MLINNARCLAPIVLCVAIAGCYQKQTAGQDGPMAMPRPNAPTTTSPHQDIAMEMRVTLAPDEANNLAEAGNAAGRPVRAIAENGKVTFKPIDPAEAAPPVNERQVTLAVASPDGTSKKVNVWVAPAAEHLLSEEKTNPP